MGTFWQAVPQSTVYPRWNFHFHFDHTKRGSMIHGLQSKPNKTKPELEFSFSFWSHSNLSRGQLAGWPVVLRLFLILLWCMKIIECSACSNVWPPRQILMLILFFYKNFHLNWSSLAPFPILCLNNLMSKRCPPRHRQTFHHILYFKLSYFLCFSYFLYFSHIS